MEKIIAASLITFTFGTLSALAQVDLTLDNFESYTTPTTSGSVLFRNPSFSGSTSSKLDTAAANSSIVESTGIPAGNANVGLNVFHTMFNFNDTGVTPLWLRLTTGTQTGALMQNPTIPIAPGWSLKFDIYSDTPIYVATAIRETDNNAAIGANGGGSGGTGIEFIGGNPSIATGTRGKTVAANTWTTLTFNGSDPVASFTGNGVLDPGTDYKGVLESLGLATDAANTGTINVWLDNFQVATVPEPSAISLLLLGGLAFLVRRMRR